MKTAANNLNNAAGLVAEARRELYGQIRPGSPYYKLDLTITDSVCTSVTNAVLNSLHLTAYNQSWINKQSQPEGWD